MTFALILRKSTTRRKPPSRLETKKPGWRKVIYWGDHPLFQKFFDHVSKYGPLMRDTPVRGIPHGRGVGKINLVRLANSRN